MTVKMYTTHCPKCNVLKKKLNNKHIPFEEISDTNIMLEKGFDVMPVLEVDGNAMQFAEAAKWVNEQ